MDQLLYATLIGLGATAIMDIWGVLRIPICHLPPPNYHMIGRWVGHIFRGTFTHQAITRSAPIAGEGMIGWITHYAVGIGYAVLLLLITGSSWSKHPSLGVALVFGLVTVIAPFFVMQPSMGAGIAASRSPNPPSARLHSVINHGVFGMGLYLSAFVLQAFLPLTPSL